MNKLENINKKIDELKKEIIKLETEKNNIKEFESAAILRITTNIKRFETIKKEINDIIDIENKNIEELGTKKLAYEFQKQKEGFYIRFNFTGTYEDVAKLEKYYRANNNILKFLNVKCEEC